MRDFPTTFGNPVNVSRYSYKKWVNFVFEHPVAIQHSLKWRNSKKHFKNIPKEKEWYWLDSWDNYCNPKTLTRNATRLFNNTEILNKYSDDQILQGLYFLGFGTDPNLPDLLYDPTVPLKLRKKCIESMENLYKNIFQTRNLTEASYMWWDWFRPPPPITHSKKWLIEIKKIPGLREKLGVGISKKNRANNARKISESTFRTLAEILKINSENCQKGALHGLNHLKHPKTKNVIQKYLKTNPKPSKQMHEYAKKCQNFKAQ